MRRAGFAIAAVLLALLVAPRLASAHEKWFVDGSKYPIHWELFFSWPVLVALGVGASAIVLLWLLRRAVGDPFWPNPDWLKPVQASSQAVVGIQTAISLVFMTVQGWLFAPKLMLPKGVLGVILAILMLFIAWTLITGWLTRLGAGMLIGLVVLALAIFSPAYVLEQALFVGIGAYFLILGRGLFRPQGNMLKQLDSRWSRYERYAMPIMRIGTGVSILVLAFTEKLLNPDLARAFLQEYPDFNFMHLLGFDWFTNDLFIYSAGAVEATVGLMLIAGILPRVVILFMWVPFNIAIPLLPPEELLGHLPILAVMYAIFLDSPKADSTLQA